MSCKPVCKLCDRLILSSAVTFTGGNLVINLPAGSYNNSQKYCIVIAQSIPSTATVTAPVVMTIGAGTQAYPLVRCDGTQATAASIRTRTRYSVRVSTTSTGGSFQLTGRICCAPNNNLRSINGTAPAV